MLPMKARYTALKKPLTERMLTSLRQKQSLREHSTRPRKLKGSKENKRFNNKGT
jgi:hypothetical protein